MTVLGVETMAAFIAALLLGVGYAVEKLEKRGIVKTIGAGNTPPPWAQRQNEILVLIAENMEDMDEEATAEYLGVDQEPGLDDVVVVGDDD